MHELNGEAFSPFAAGEADRSCPIRFASFITAIWSLQTVIPPVGPDGILEQPHRLLEALQLKAAAYGVGSHHL